jgi:hypothetical protein
MGLKAVGGGRGPLAVKSEIVALFRPRQSGVSKLGMGHEDTRASGIIAATVNDRSLRVREPGHVAAHSEHAAGVSSDSDSVLLLDPCQCLSLGAVKAGHHCHGPVITQIEGSHFGDCIFSTLVRPFQRRRAYYSGSRSGTHFARFATEV